MVILAKDDTFVNAICGTFFIFFQILFDFAIFPQITQKGGEIFAAFLVFTALLDDADILLLLDDG